MLKSLFSKITGDPNAKAISKLQPLVDDINTLEAEFKSMSDDELLAVTVEFRAELNEALQDLRAELDAARAEAFDEADDDQRRQLDAQIKKIEDELFKAEADQLTGFLPRAFAAVREASRRHTTLRHFDVQMIGGVVLHQGKIAEMKTGEGKTLVATLPLYLNALTSRGCHLVTVNDYLARRDGGWMGPIYHALGLSVGLITHDFSGLYDPEYVDPQGYLEDERLVHWKPCTRAEAYRADITYGTSSEFGFDYLRDNLTTELSQCVQRDFYYAIVDEVDNILIDESRTPLIISGPTDEATDEYRRFAEIVRLLKRNTAPEDAEPNGDFNIDERTRAITLTERGIARVEAALVAQNVLREGESVYDPQYVALTPYLDNGLKAQHVFKRDKEYVVMDGHVIIVDERTGRLMPGRRYSEGLHQAIEAKEGVNIRREDATLATITLQNFFRMYLKLAGMTGTAATESEEFYRIYGLEVVVIPTNVEQVVSQPESGLRPVREKADGVEQIVYQDAAGRPVFHRRVDYPDQVYQSEAAKYRAIVADIKHLHEQGSPILVGTTSVENSEKLHEMLSQDKIRHEVLNAKQHQREAAIVAQAGRSGAVTISTSMAGRGTDILLGGYPEGLAIERLTELCFDERSFERLAREALADANTARQTARRDARLSPDLVDWILKAEADYEAVAAAIGSTGDLTSYLAQRLQAAPHQMAYDDALALVRYVRDGQFDAARELVRIHNYSLELIALVRSWQNDYSRHPSVQAAMRQRGQPTPDELATFLAPVLFEKHYNARAALIRSVLQGDVERAKQLVTDMPGVPAQAIEEIQAIKTRCEQDRQRVRELGGLRIIGTERYEARRIDNQLRGRAARQGDPGYSTFYLSFEDELMRRFGGDAASRLMGRFGVDENMPLEHRWVDRAIEGAQEKVESYYFDMRKNLVEYDDVVNRQRETVYGERREILKGSSANLEAQIESYFADEIEALLDRYLDGFLPWMQSQINEAVQEHSNLETGRVSVNGLIARLRGILPQIYSLDRERLAEMDGERVGEELYHLAEEAHTQNHHIRLLAQEVTRFIPLWPALPDMRGVRDYGQRLKAEQQYKADVQNVFDGLVTEEVKEVDRAQLWAITDNAIADAFRDFAVENVSAQERRKRFEALAVNLNNAVGQMLLAVLTALDREQLEAALLDRAEQMLEKWRELIGTDDLRTYEQWLFLSTIDREWQQYLEAIDDLRQGIGLEAFGQRDPKIEYKRRALDMFEELRDSVRHTIVDNFFRQLPDHQRFIEARRANAALRERAAQANYRLEQRKRGTTMRRDVQKVNRNDPCPCGSGKKYKNCHGRLGTQPTAEASMIDQPAAGQGKQRK